jgi:hypothetical protein
MLRGWGISVPLAWFMAAAAYAQNAQSQGPVTRVSFEVENLKGVANQKFLENKIKSIAGVAECTVAGNRVTIIVKYDSTLKLSDLRKAVAEIKPEGKDQPPKIKEEMVKLEGKVDIELDLVEDLNKAFDAVRTTSNVTECKLNGSTLCCQVKSPAGVLIGALLKAIEKKVTPKENTKLASCVKDVTWYAVPKPPDKPAAGPAPTPAPQPGAKPPPKPGGG